MIDSFSSPRLPVPTAAQVYYGVAISTALSGIVWAQAHDYARRNADGWLIRGTVACVIVFDLAVTALALTSGHFILVVDGTSGIRAFFTFMSLTMMVSQLLAFITQSYMASRLYLLKPMGVSFALFCGFISFASLVTGVVAQFMIASDSRLLVSGANASPKIRLQEILATTVHGLSAIADVVFTSAICYRLGRFRSMSERKRTRAVLWELFLFLLNRGVVVTACQCTIAAFWLHRPLHTGWVVPGYSLGKMYTITLLEMLNARRRLNEQLDSPAYTNPFGLRHSFSMPKSPSFPMLASRIPSSVRAVTNPRSDVGWAWLASQHGYDQWQISNN